MQSTAKTVALTLLLTLSLTAWDGSDELPTPTPTATPIPAGVEPGWTPLVDTETFGIPMVYVPAGCFMMGSEDGRSNERPVHEVCLSAFWIAQAEVTNAQYAECADAGACEPPGCTFFDDPDYADHPVVCVDWNQANAYAAWLSGVSGQACDLPTEAQWEYAARGPTRNVYPWGNEPPTCELANYNYCLGRHTTPAGSYEDGASWVGALDVAGNVREWVVDWYDEDYYATVQDGEWDLVGPESGNDRVVRGGGWGDGVWSARAAHRSWLPFDAYCYVTGFRVVCAPPTS